MSFRAETYRVLIASPSDLAEEREAGDRGNQKHAVALVVPLNKFLARVAWPFYICSDSAVPAEIAGPIVGV
jgi:hypothetical protein